ncbi:hypothetical protein HK405_009959, partial [Cladochytrium tenue]
MAFAPLGSQATPSINITATGASFPSSVYVAATQAYIAKYPSVIETCSYTQSDSTGGQTDQHNNASTWGGSDIAINAALVGTYPTLVAIPAVAGAIVAAYNVPELVAVNASLRLGRGVLPLIFNGNITAWNDSRIQADNADDVRTVLAAITKPIQLVVRKMTSGTSINFRAALNAMDPAAVKLTDSFASLVPSAYLVTSGGNLAVGNVIAAVPYTLTYMDAHELSQSNTNNTIGQAYLENSSGNYLQASSQGIK